MKRYVDYSFETDTFPKQALKWSSVYERNANEFYWDLPFSCLVSILKIFYVFAKFTI